MLQDTLEEIVQFLQRVFVRDFIAQFANFPESGGRINQPPFLCAIQGIQKRAAILQLDTVQPPEEFLQDHPNPDDLP
jgi:hypothetical protein